MMVSDEDCKHESVWFDRVFCACGDMHYYCDDCGSQVDSCTYMGGY